MFNPKIELYFFEMQAKLAKARRHCLPEMLLSKSDFNKAVRDSIKTMKPLPTTLDDFEKTFGVSFNEKTCMYESKP